ncbi:hypothetical protein PIB30_003107 [Stylosanthes scabra]|uniref:Uncharacterized protein n=1 Tax=Stylosanthes scabra TaxID=79078 RepID=A0ABU6Y2R8_9FABA|nr:hypothetical protein [Stylosanthes scabra]
MIDGYEVIGTQTPTELELFRETNTWKRDRSIMEKRANDLLIEFSANLEQATQQAQEQGDDSAGSIDPNSVWRQTLFGFGGSSASAASTHTGPDAVEVVDLREQRDALAEEQLRRMEEMSQQMAAFYDQLRPGSNAAAGGSGSSTANPLPLRPPPRQLDHPPVDDDHDYEDA